MKKAIKVVSVSVISLIMSLLIPVSANAACTSYSTGRVTCSNSNGFGGSSFNSYNPRTGYQSFGTSSSFGNTRNSYGTATYGSGTTRNWSTTTFKKRY